VGEASDILRALSMPAGLDARRRRASYCHAVVARVANTRCGAERERRYGAPRLLTLATLRLPHLLAVHGGLLHSEEECGAPCLVAQAVIGASSGAMRLAHRALEIHALELGYGVQVWLERGRDELREGERGELSLPATLDQARLATLALTRATASTANEPMQVPGQIADALAHLLAIYVIAVEVASAT
jgi:hypothetical protein